MYLVNKCLIQIKTTPTTNYFKRLGGVSENVCTTSTFIIENIMLCSQTGFWKQI